MPVNTTIQIRKGTATQWSSTNPVLGSGEPGFDTTNKILKIGDGSTVWNSLLSTSFVADSAIFSNVNVLSAVYDSVSFSVQAQEISSTDLFFSPDGLKMYTLGSNSDNVNEYNLSTAWVVSSAVYSTSFSVASQEGAPQGMFFRADGLKMYIVGGVDSVFQYTLSTPWSVATASYDSISFSVTAQETTVHGVFFKPNGLSMYVVGPANDFVLQYTLSTAWSVSSATYLQSFSILAQEGTSRALFFTGDGSRMFVCGTASVGPNVYNLTTPWDISTAAFVNVFNVSGQDTFISGIYIKPDGTKMYILGNSSDVVYQYTVPSIDIQLTGSTSVAALDVQQDLNVYGKTTVANLTGFGGTVNLSGGRSSFPAIANVSSGANTLDDYEEGTFTPTFTASTTNPTVTYNASTYGAYVKIGRLVFINLRIRNATLTSAGTGNIRIAGLPFSSNATDGFGQLSVGYRGSWTTTAPTIAYVESAQTYINLGTVSGGGIAMTTQAHLAAATDVMISGFYTTTS